MSFKDLIDGTQIGHGTASSGFSLGFGKGGLSLSANFNQRLQQKMTKSPVSQATKELYRDFYEGEDTLIFPADLDYERYLMIERISRKKEKTLGKEIVKTEKSFVLPLPTQLNPSYHVDYKDQALGVAGALSSNMMTEKDLLNGGKAAFGVVNDAWEKFTKGTGGFEDQQVKNVATGLGVVATAGLIGKAIGGPFGGLVAAAAGGAGTYAQGIMKSERVAFNPQMAVLFDGMGFRSFQFGYRFVPRDKDESDTLRELIFHLKKGMHPSLPATNKFLFEYPDEFDIQFCEAVKPYMFKVKRCVLKDFNVTYNGDGVPRFFEDGAPVVVDINMTFQETEIVTKQDFNSPEDSA